MALFDFDSALQGAAAGSFNPYVAAAGFVLGGFAGGRSKKKRREADRKRKAEIAAAMSAKRRADLTRELLPLYRNLIAAGPGAAKQQDVASNLARHGYTGTGVGEVMRAASGRLPEFEALRLATDDARDLQRNQIVALSGQAFDPYPYEYPSAYGASDLGAMANTFGTLFGKKPKAAPDYRDSLFPGGVA